MTVITPGAGCSTTSTTTVSRTGCFRASFPGAFFTAARLGLGLATVRFVAFADFAPLAALPRLAEFPLCSLARFWTFDPFFRLAMIAPFGAPQRYNPLSRAKHQTAGYQQIAVERATAGATPRNRFAIYDAV